MALLVAFDFNRTFGAGFAGFLMSRILVAFFLAVTLEVALLVVLTWRALTISLIAPLVPFLEAFKAEALVVLTATALVAFKVAFLEAFLVAFKDAFLETFLVTLAVTLAVALAVALALASTFLAVAGALVALATAVLLATTVLLASAALPAAGAFFPFPAAAAPAAGFLPPAAPVAESLPGRHLTPVLTSLPSTQSSSSSVGGGGGGAGLTRVWQLE